MVHVSTSSSQKMILSALVSTDSKCFFPVKFWTTFSRCFVLGNIDGVNSLAVGLVGALVEVSEVARLHVLLAVLGVVLLLETSCSQTIVSPH